MGDIVVRGEDASGEGRLTEKREDKQADFILV